MSFTPGMPAQGSSLGSTRVPFVNELAGIRSTMNANHVDQNNAGAGKHSFTQWANVASGLTSATELGWFNNNNGVAQRFFMRQPNSGTIIQMSGIDPVVDASAGCTFLPGGLLFQWGGGATTGTSTSVAFAKGSASGFKLLNIIGLSLGDNTRRFGYDNITNSGFDFITSGGNAISFGYAAIGTMA